jgi:hypothetical protein
MARSKALPHEGRTAEDSADQFEQRSEPLGLANSHPSMPVRSPAWTLSRAALSPPGCRRISLRQTFLSEP